MSRNYPSYRVRPDKNLAVVTLTDSLTGKRRDYYLGEYDSPESRERYHQLIAAWDRANGQLPPPLVTAAVEDTDLKVVQVVSSYWNWAKDYYRPAENQCLIGLLRLLRQFYGSVSAVSFGPKRLRELRDFMIAGDASATPPRRPWSRRYINAQVKRLIRMFKWAAGHEMISVTVYQQLTTIEPLKRGRCAARENAAVKPVPESQFRPFDLF